MSDLTRLGNGFLDEGNAIKDSNTHHDVGRFDHGLLEDLTVLRVGDQPLGPGLV